MDIHSFCPRVAAVAAASAFLVLIPPSARAFTEDPARLVRSSEARTPQQEREGFHLLKGFEVQLFADETQLGGKPVNMAFDTKGRLWVTCAREYPFAVPKDRWIENTTRAKDSRDTIRILEDTQGTGHADKVTIFADGMNLNTGVAPFKSGCIAWSIPNILLLEDTKGTGKADKRTILFGPLGYEKDTHGMISSIRVGPDGWVYATHGFSNTSHFHAKDGSTLDLTSGNTFRFRPDGLRVEGWTSGQVNPFGMCWDSWGNLYSADCHSSPLYQLMRGAFYPSFGRPHDGLGFAPIMCDHAHGSTGIAGIVYIDGGIWGPEWDDHTLVGNPVTSIVNHDHITFTGSSPTANEAPEFLSSDDLWFRPVDLQIGPDGALYIADFYNKIIGHYELPLDDPRRDRVRGRIWRVVRTGHTTPLRPFQADAEHASLALDSPNITVRRLALQYLEEQYPDKAFPLNHPLGERGDAAYQWWRLSMERNTRQPLKAREGARQIISDPAKAFAAVHLLQQVVEFGFMEGCRREDVISGLINSNALVVRSAANVLQAHPALPSLRPLLAAMEKAPAGDTHLRHALRLAIREHLKLAGAFAEVDRQYAKEPPGVDLLTLVQALPTAEAADWLLKQLQAAATGKRPLDQSLWTQSLTHVAHHLPAEREGDLVAVVKSRFADDLDTQLNLFSAIQEGQQARGTDFGPKTKAWAASLAQQVIEHLPGRQASDWKPIASPHAGPSPWIRRQLHCKDDKEAWFLDSLSPGGESLTGALRSKTFDLPEKLTFWLAGHRGPPEQPPHKKSFIRIVNADKGEEIRRAYPPRSDSPRKITWDFSESPVERAYLELVDGDNGDKYAWLAAGRFEPEVVLIPDLGGASQDARIRVLAVLARTLDLPNTRETLLALPGKDGFSPDTREALAKLLATVAADHDLEPMASLARDPDLGATTLAILEARAKAVDLLSGAFKTQSYRTQVKLATALTTNTGIARKLLELAPPRVLADPLVTGKLKALNDPALTQELAKLTGALPPQNAAIDNLIASRAKSFDPAKADSDRGGLIFMSTCSVCHRIGVRGNLVGPQLDGIGSRGVERLLEDIIDPNRSVDPAFRLHFVKEKNGDLLAGLLRHEEDGIITYADAAGQEHKVNKADVVQDQISEFSLMPAGFGEVLSEAQIHDLLKFLLDRKS